MVAYNPPGPSAYAPNPVNTTTNAPIVDANDNIIPSAPGPNFVQPFGSAGGYVSVPTQVLSAILIELRVLSSLLLANSSTNFDISSLRADEASGSTGGAIN
jgi:hypothetical protein